MRKWTFVMPVSFRWPLRRVRRHRVILGDPSLVPPGTRDLRPNGSLACPDALDKASAIYGDPPFPTPWFDVKVTAKDVLTLPPLEVTLSKPDWVGGMSEERVDPVECD